MKTKKDPPEDLTIEESLKRERNEEEWEEEVQTAIDEDNGVHFTLRP